MFTSSCFCFPLPFGVAWSSAGEMKSCSDGVRVTACHRDSRTLTPRACWQPAQVAKVSGKFVDIKHISKNWELSELSVSRLKNPL